MTKDVYNFISRIVSYGLNEHLLEECDKIYVLNQMLELFRIDSPKNFCFVKSTDKEENLEEILDGLLDYAFLNGIVAQNTVTYRDLFDAKIMNILIKKPSEIIREFWNQYKKSASDATNYYYNLSKKSNYIKSYRIKKDIKWKTSTEYGDIDITINLSKPEKDPKDIANMKNIKSVSYPKCLLCRENEGYAGNINYPARDNHRIIPLTLDNSRWYLQYSPYTYYNEHCIVLSENHSPMVIDSSTFRKLFDFIKIFPHYTIGSNADLPIVGGSILTHEHFQGGRYRFPLNNAKVEEKFNIGKYSDVECGIVKWPMSVIRLKSKNTDHLISVAAHIMKSWQKYDDYERGIISRTEGTLHNTITPIALKEGGYYLLDLTLRNNITSSQHPLGVFHPHQNLHHIKKENIGLIEVMGLAILPARLKKEMQLLKEAILTKQSIKGIPEISKHNEWITEVTENYNEITENNIDDILKYEIGKVFLNVLIDAGVFKRTAHGKDGFKKFISSL